MMKEFSMHVLDIAQNGISAGAGNLTITINEETDGWLTLTVADDGSGMDEHTKNAVRDPFVTSRTTRKVGLGIPMLEQTCLMCGGGLNIDSALGVGTKITAQARNGHIDLPPMGDIGETVYLLSIMNQEINVVYTHVKDGKTYVFDSGGIKEVLDGVPLNTPEVSEWIRNDIKDGLAGIGVTA